MLYLIQGLFEFTVIIFLAFVVIKLVYKFIIDPVFKGVNKL